MPTNESRSVDRLQRAERVLKPIGWVLALATAVALYLWNGSLWLAAFGLIMVSRTVNGSAPKIIYHGRKLYRTAFYLLWPVGGTLLLYWSYQQWEMMWLAVLIGVFGGIVVSMVGGLLFFRGIVVEDQRRETQVAEQEVDKTLRAHPDAVAMKQRFSSSEWEEIRGLPLMLFLLVTLSGDDPGKTEAEVWADAHLKPEKYEDPLLRAMLIEEKADMLRSMGGLTPISQLSSVMTEGSLQRNLEALAASGKLQMSGETFAVDPGAFETIRASLAPDEFRSFVHGLVRLGMDTAFAGGPPKPEQIEILFKLVPAESKEDLFAMLGIDEEAGTADVFGGTGGA